MGEDSSSCQACQRCLAHAELGSRQVQSLLALGPPGGWIRGDYFSMVLSLQSLAGIRPEGPEVSAGKLGWVTWRSGVG